MESFEKPPDMGTHALNFSGYLELKLAEPYPPIEIAGYHSEVFIRNCPEITFNKSNYILHDVIFIIAVKFRINIHTSHIGLT